MALARPATAISLFVDSNSSLRGQPSSLSLRAGGGVLHWHYERSVFGRQRCCRVPYGQVPKQFMQRSVVLVVEDRPKQARMRCPAVRNRLLSSPNWTSVVDLVKLYSCCKMCSLVYVILSCVSGAPSTWASAAARALYTNLHSDVVEQCSSTIENLKIKTHGRRGKRLLEVFRGSDMSVYLEPTSLQDPFQSRRDSSLRSKTCESWCFADNGSSERHENSSSLSNILFVGLGQGRRKKNNSFVKRAADLVGPAVVRLDTERDFPAGEQEVVQTRDRLFRQWFGESELPNQRKFRRERGQGSGFVFNGGQGLVVTNAHVVKGADRVKVTFTDGRVYDGQVVGTDDVTDIALIKVALLEGEVLPTALLGDSRSVELGDWVIAVGNPFGLDNTVSLGIISNLHRTAAEVGIPDKRLDFLQTDCAINPGNSGGPLLNEFGEVIGINTAIRADAEGISFAIPINKATKIIDALGDGRPVQHAFVGIQMATLSVELARHYNADPNTGVPIPEAEGVLIVKVSADSPAAFAGLRSGDVIVQVDGVAISSSTQLQRLVESAFVGQTFDLRFWRGDKSMEVTLATGDMASYFAKSENSNFDSRQGNNWNHVNGFPVARAA